MPSPANREDRISLLSDDLLIHILSFLRTEQAVATSVLSQRWRNLWTLVPVLNYNNQPFIGNHRKPPYSFERLVYATTLLSRPRPIRTFRLRYEIPEDNARAAAAADVGVWVDTAVQRGVQNLEIRLVNNPQEFGLFQLVLLRFSIFSCSRTLVVLKLQEVYLTMNSSCSVDLPLLKSLHLKTVKFEDPQHFMDFLYGCPMLEKLKANNIDYADHSIVCKERVKNLSNLVRADLRFVGLEFMEVEDSQGGTSTNILLKAVSNVKFMIIEEYEEFGFDADNVAAQFPHLTHLALAFPPPKNADWLLLMLKNSPKLKCFKLDVSFEPEGANDLPYPDFVPDCLTSSLTRCYLKCSLGTKSDLQFAKYILQNSACLQFMRFRHVSPNPLEAIQELAFCPRKSASCEVTFWC